MLKRSSRLAPTLQLASTSSPPALGICGSSLPNRSASFGGSSGARGSSGRPPPDPVRGQSGRLQGLGLPQFQHASKFPGLTSSHESHVHSGRFSACVSLRRSSYCSTISRARAKSNSPRTQIVGATVWGGSSPVRLEAYSFPIVTDRPACRMRPATRCASCKLDARYASRRPSFSPTSDQEPRVRRRRSTPSVRTTATLKVTTTTTPVPSAAGVFYVPEPDFGTID
jgi:hypothetical protein